MVRWLFVLSILAILLTLGFWQLDRLRQKEHLLAEISQNKIITEAELSSKPYRIVELKGHFFCKELHLFATGRLGKHIENYMMLDVLRAESGKYYLVNLFDKHQYKDTHYRVWQWEKTPFWGGSNLRNNQLLWVDQQDLEQYYGIKLSGYLLSETEIDISSIPNKHLEYAVTWFIFAMVFAAGVLHKKL